FAARRLVAAQPPRAIRLAAPTGRRPRTSPATAWVLSAPGGATTGRSVARRGHRRVLSDGRPLAMAEPPQLVSAKFLVAAFAGIFDPLHGGGQRGRIERALGGGGDQRGGGGLLCSGQFVEAFLTLPDVVPCTAVLVVLDLREVLPRLAGNLVQVGGAFDEFGFVEDQAPAQHATQVFAGLHHVLENGRTLAQRRVRVNAVTTHQDDCGEQRHAHDFQLH